MHTRERKKNASVPSNCLAQRHSSLRIQRVPLINMWMERPVTFSKKKHHPGVSQMERFHPDVSTQLDSATPPIPLSNDSSRSHTCSNEPQRPPVKLNVGYYSPSTHNWQSCRKMNLFCCQFWIWRTKLFALKESRHNIYLCSWAICPVLHSDRSSFSIPGEAAKK